MDKFNGACNYVITGTLNTLSLMNIDTPLFNP